MKKEIFDQREWKSSKTNRRMQYLFYSPSQNEPVPLILYLHGAGSRGNTLSSIAHVGPLLEVDNGRSIPAAIAAPLCEKDNWFEIFETLLDFVDTMAGEPNIDRSRIYLTGVSMGGYAAWQLAMSRPEVFAALIPICGGGMEWNAARLRNIPIWAFHGALDTTVSPQESLKMVAAVNKNGGSAKITLFEKTAHNAWDYVFSREEVWNWLFSNRKIKGVASVGTEN